MIFFKKLISKVSILILFFLLTNIYTNIVYAEDFRTNYKVEYFLSNSKENIESEARYSINITNLKEGFYVSKFTLSFPKSFAIDNITASDDTGTLEPEISQTNDAINIQLTFNNPNTGIREQNNFYLKFNQRNLFNINGNIWEVILPVVEKRKDENYQIEVNLPNNSDRKISISKPAPTSINQNTITWLNPLTKTIYAVFGDSQLYQLNLYYNLYNPKITNGYMDVAFPPDMSNQKIFIKSIDPLPEKTYIDEDGNYIGRFVLKPREKKKIEFKAIAQITAVPREEVKLHEIEMFNLQKNYLLNESIYWKVDNIEKYKNLGSPTDIYNYITSKFDYDYSRISKDIKRLGAEYALRNPKNAVCTEFSDAFVAISREKGIFSREIQGYGFSDSKELRPLSLVADVLHSWPQYFNSEKNLWISIDPTWENTSGIDYFSSFDLNHIAFAIHGKKPDYPLPAGMYKVDDTRDISIKPTIEKPIEIIKVDSEINFPNSISKNKEYKGVFTVINNSNVFLYGLPLEIKSKTLVAKLSQNKISVIAPNEKKDITFTIAPTKSDIAKGDILILINNKTVLEKEVKLYNPIKIYIIGGSFILAVLVLVIFKKIRENRI